MFKGKSMPKFDAFFCAGLLAVFSLAAPAAANHVEGHGSAKLAQAPDTSVTPASASAPVDEAIAFAQQMTADATAALTKQGASEAQKLEAFEKVLSESLALDVIGKFMLGENRKSMSEAQIARYEAVFPDYMTRQYADQFKDIVGRPLEVLEAKALGARDVIVRTQFKRSEGSPIMVDWRVRKLKSGEQKMIDIIVAGVSIMLVKREEFSSFIATNGIDALIARLEQEAGRA
jgi:ABC-type transporter MlaC component